MARLLDAIYDLGIFVRTTTALNSRLSTATLPVLSGNTRRKNLLKSIRLRRTSRRLLLRTLLCYIRERLRRILENALRPVTLKILRFLHTIFQQYFFKRYLKRCINKVPSLKLGILLKVVILPKVILPKLGF